MIVSKAKQWLAQLCHLSPFLDSASLSIMYKSFILSCLEYGHFLYFSAARSHLEHLDAHSVELLVFVMTLLLWNHTNMLQQSG